MVYINPYIQNWVKEIKCIKSELAPALGTGHSKGVGRGDQRRQPRIRLKHGTWKGTQILVRNGPQ